MAHKDTDQPAVEKTQTEPADVDLSGGVEDGTVEKDNDQLSDLWRERIEHEEKVVHEFDDKGKLVGFHKEPADGSTPEEQKHVLQPGQEEEEDE